MKLKDLARMGAHVRIAELEQELSDLRAFLASETASNSDTDRSESEQPADLPAADLMDLIPHAITVIKRRGLTPEGRARISAAQKARWRKLKHSARRATLRKKS